MYAVEWDKKTRGIKLIPSGEGSVLPVVRPVFYEELDLLDFDKFWNYPKAEEPLLWCVNRTYYYEGRKVARAIGGGFFEKPKIEIYENNLELEPVNVKAMVRRNKEIMERIIFLTLDFIREVKEKYHNYNAVVGFSGGKDSMVLLDLVQRAIPPDEFIVIFNDTSMELSPTYEFVGEAIKFYSNLRFYIAKHNRKAVELWREFGPPSRVHRWCCTVYKTLPTIRLLRKMYGEKVRVLFYDGVRAEENVKRAKLTKISRGKHFQQLNVHPIIDWNTAMVYLYIFSRKLPINKLYRYGAVRVGCAVCPFESSWWEAIVWLKYRDEIKPYLDLIREYAKCRGVKDVSEFIKEGNWKARVGGEGWQKNRVIVVENEGISIYIDSPKAKSFTEWVKVVGDVSLDGNMLKLSFNGRDHVARIERGSKYAIRLSDVDQRLLNVLKLVASKSAYCVACGVCEVECPHGAIIFNNGLVKVITENCVHCHRCLRVVDRGCLVADSLKVRLGGKSMNIKKIGNYKHFGIRKEWLEEFFEDPDKWWTENSLGPVQFEAMRRWLVDAEIITGRSKGFTLTETGKLLREIGVDDTFTWAVIWTNLARNSSLISWYVSELEWGKTYSRDELLGLMGDNLSIATRKNGLQSLIELFSKSPIGSELKLGVVHREKRVVKIEKRGFIHEKELKIDLDIILYSLYRLKELEGTEYFSISYLYDESTNEGPFKLFGIPRELLERALRGLQERYGKEWIAVEITADLDNISLNPGKNSLDVLKLHLKEKRI